MKLKDLIKEAENDMYSDAGENAPDEVKAAIQRWRNLSNAERGDKPLLYWLLGSGTPPYKMSPQEAKYTNPSEVEGQMCHNCEFAYLKIANKKFICSQISSHIQPKGWCKLWKKGNEVS
jgi:High potential iron-sulfur protein